MFGREKEYYSVFMINPNVNLFTDCHKDFKYSVNTFIQKRMNEPGRKISDFELVDQGIRHMLSSGYELVYPLTENYWSNPTDECDPSNRCEDFSLPICNNILGESFFDSVPLTKNNDNICAVFTHKGFYADDFEIALYQSLQDNNSFLSGCNKFHPSTETIKFSNYDGFMKKIRTYLKSKKYKPIESYATKFYCSHNSINRGMHLTHIRKCSNFGGYENSRESN